jgi:hypothetical protein
MVAALIEGTADVATMGQFARGRMREKIPQLEKALAGTFGAHQRFLSTQQLAHIDFLDALIEQASTQIAERVRPFAYETPLCRATESLAHSGVAGSDHPAGGLAPPPALSAAARLA